ncbi:hypothetical protein SUGI_0336590 [Cryptomeria japonica]|nr:hypothetical protein SUGI_0336590 [Cryptomeria japonica]
MDNQDKTVELQFVISCEYRESFIKFQSSMRESMAEIVQILTVKNGQGSISIKDKVTNNSLHGKDLLDEKLKSKQKEVANKEIYEHEPENSKEQSKTEQKTDEDLVDQTMLIEHEDAKIETNVPMQVPYTNL